MVARSLRSPRRLGERRRKLPALLPCEQSWRIHTAPLWQNDTEPDPYEAWCDCDFCQEPTSPDPEGCLAEPTLPLNEVDRQVRALHPRLHPSPENASAPRIAHLLDPAALRHLAALVRPSPAEQRYPEEVRAFLARHRVEAPLSPEIDSLERLAARALLRLHGLPDPAEIRWEPLGALLRAALRQNPEGLAVEPVILAFHEAIFEEGSGLRGPLARAPWHEGWLPLVPWIAASLRPSEMAPRMEGPRGSWLALASVKAWLAGPCDRVSLDGERTCGAGVAAFPEVMARGGGSLASLDYPSFRLVNRSSFAELSPEQRQRLTEIRGQWVQVQAAACNPERGLHALFSLVAPSLWGDLPAEARSALTTTLLRSIAAYLGLRRDPAMASLRLRRSHLVTFGERHFPPGKSPRNLHHGHPTERVVEGLVLALLSELHQPVFEEESLQVRLKEMLIESARLVACCHGVYWLPEVDFAQEWNPGSLLLNELLRCVDHAPLELLQALGMDPRQGLPKLRGGQGSGMEVRFRALLREVTRGSRFTRGEAKEVFHCRPIGKEEALYRGELGRDCSSRSIPLRALAPHSVYYGIFRESGEQVPGYMTVFEAWALVDGETRPVLCLETINEPRQILAGVQQDLLVIFEAIARHRGLSPGLVLITQRGTWNYTNGAELFRCRRVRQGQPAWLAPGDPVVWRSYGLSSGEAGHYASFAAGSRDALLSLQERSSAMVLLAPLAPDQDTIQPENTGEARRIEALPRRGLRETCRTSAGLVGFVSGACS